MKETLKRFIKYSMLGPFLRNWIVRGWEKNGRPVPPPNLVKERVLSQYAREHSLKVFVETGTFHGDMVYALKNVFDRIYSIELDDTLFSKASRRFELLKHVQVIHGDSGLKLGEVMAHIDQRALFWLDAHYSSGKTARGDQDTPIYLELEHVFNSGLAGHVIVIDDARFFGTDPAYPTLVELTDFIRSKSDNVQISVLDDLIRVVPCEAVSENSDGSACIEACSSDMCEKVSGEKPERASGLSGVTQGERQ